MKKKKNKKWVILTVCLFLAGGTGIFGLRYILQNRAKEVEVVSVADINAAGWITGMGDGMGTSGTVVSDVSQQVYVPDDRVINEVFVSEGDKVKIGDKLLTYDTTLLELDRELQELNVQELGLEIKSAEADLKKLYNTTPVNRPAGEEEEPDGSLLDLDFGNNPDGGDDQARIVSGSRKMMASQEGVSEAVVTEPQTQAATEAPVTEPQTQAPTEAPVTEPQTQAPTEAPVTEPQTQAATEAPVTEPQTQAPTDAPVTETPATEPQSNGGQPTDILKPEDLAKPGITVPESESGSEQGQTEKPKKNQSLKKLLTHVRLMGVGEKEAVLLADTREQNTPVEILQDSIRIVPHFKENEKAHFEVGNTYLMMIEGIRLEKEIKGKLVGTAVIDGNDYPEIGSFTLKQDTDTRAKLILEFQDGLKTQHKAATELADAYVEIVLKPTEFVGEKLGFLVSDKKEENLILDMKLPPSEAQTEPSTGETQETQGTETPQSETVSTEVTTEPTTETTTETTTEQPILPQTEQKINLNVLWNHGTNSPENWPQSLEVCFYKADGSETTPAYTVSMTAENAWEYKGLWPQAEKGDISAYVARIDLTNVPDYEVKPKEILNLGSADGITNGVFELSYKGSVAPPAETVTKLNVKVEWYHGDNNPAQYPTAMQIQFYKKEDAKQEQPVFTMEVQDNGNIIEDGNEETGSQEVETEASTEGSTETLPETEIPQEPSGKPEDLLDPNGQPREDWTASKEWPQELGAVDQYIAAVLVENYIPHWVWTRQEDGSWLLTVTMTYLKPEDSPLVKLEPHALLTYETGIKNKYYKGSGTKEDPYVFFVTDGVRIESSFVNWVLGFDASGTVKEREGCYALLEIRESDTITGAFIRSIGMDGTILTDYGFGPGTYWIFSSDSGIIRYEEEVPEEGGGSMGGGFPDFPWGEDIGMTYTPEELAQAIKDKEREIRKLKLDERSAKLKLKDYDKDLEESTVISSVNGFVKSMSGNTKADEAYMVLASEGGLYLKTTVNELELDKVKKGDQLSATSWESQRTFTASVTEINYYPVSTSADPWSGGNVNASSYPVLAYIDDTSGLTPYESVNVVFDKGSNRSAGVYIPKAYVRSENGQSYVYKRDSVGRLKKQYIRTSDTMYEYIGVKEGLTEEDMIAFPYGKAVKEGAKTKEASNDMIYG